MTMGIRGFRFKKDLKDPLKGLIGKELQPHIIETSIFGNEFKETGDNIVVGPCAHTKRDWFAKIVCKDGIITKIS